MEESVRLYLEQIPEATEETIENSEPYKPDQGLRELHLFAKKNTLSQKDDKYYGQWHNSFGKACRGAPTTYIEEGAILGFDDVGKCSGTEDIVVDCIHL